MIQQPSHELWTSPLVLAPAPGAVAGQKTFHESLADALILQAQRDPYFDLPGYMRRWWVTRPSNHGGATLHGSRIHQILRSDNERHLHDHPWDCTSVILRGGCWEVMPADQAQPAELDLDPAHLVTVWRSPGDVIHRKAEDRHRLVLAGADCWTYFITEEKRREWGYHVPGAPGNWVHHLDYDELMAAWSADQSSVTA